MSLIVEGNVSAFTTLFNHHRDKVYSVAIKLTRDTSLAEEIVEDVFMVIWERRETLSAIENFQAYLYTIVRNKTYRVMKDIARRFLTEELHGECHSQTHNNTENHLLDKEYTSLLRQAIDRLPLQQRKVYQLIKQEDKKRDEAAEILKIHPETVKYHLAEAMKNIRAFCLPYLDILIGMGLFLFY